MSAFFNMGSLLLGLAAWTMAAIAVWRSLRNRGTQGLSVCSFACCTAAVTLQILEIQNRVRLMDMSAIMDTIDAVAGASINLVAVTIALNIAAYAIGRAKARAAKA